MKTLIIRGNILFLQSANRTIWSVLSAVYTERKTFLYSTVISLLLLLLLSWYSILDDHFFKFNFSFNIRLVHVSLLLVFFFFLIEYSKTRVWFYANTVYVCTAAPHTPESITGIWRQSYRFVPYTIVDNTPRSFRVCCRRPAALSSVESYKYRVLYRWRAQVCVCVCV